jgi:perosamine synthetase
MDALKDLARNRHHLALIEDASEAIGARFDGRIAGSFGDLAVLGFYPNKQITTGEGGAVLAGDPAHAARLRQLRNQGRDASAAIGSITSSPATTIGFRSWPARSAAFSCSGSMRSSLCAVRPPSVTMPCSRMCPVSNVRRSQLPRRELSWFVYVVRLPEGVGPRSSAGRTCRPGHRHRSLLRAHPPAACVARARAGPAWSSFPLTESIARRTLGCCRFSTASQPSSSKKWQTHLREAIAGSV